MAKYREHRDSENNLTAYIETGTGRSISLDNKKLLNWLSQGGVPGSDPDVLEKVKGAKILEYKIERNKRIASYVPEWTGDLVEVIASIWNMLGTSNAAQAAAKDIYLYVKDDAIEDVKLLNTIEEVQAYPGTPDSPVDVVNDPSWP